MSIQRRALALLAALCMVTSLGACAWGVSMPWERDIVKAIEKLAGPSDLVAFTVMHDLPYTRPIPPDSIRMMVGNTEVYRNVYPDTTVVIRPMSRGPQTLMYITSEAGKSDFTFKFNLPKGAALRKEPDGSVSMFDRKTKLSGPALMVPWAKSADGKQNLPTHYTIAGNTVTQHIELKGASFPVIADPEYDDATSMLLHGKFPILGQAKVATKDGPSTYILGVRFYAGPNGLEIRLTHIASIKLVDIAITLDGVALLTVLTKSYGPMIALSLGQAASVASVAWAAVTGVASDLVDKDQLVDQYALHGKCLAVTIPRSDINGLAGMLTYWGSMASGQFANVRLRNARWWTEPCSPSDNSYKKSIATSPGKESSRSTDTEPAVKASPIPTQPKTRPHLSQSSKVSPAVTSHAQSTAPVKPSPSAPRYHNISMDDACKMEYPDSSAKARVGSMSDEHSWACANGTGTVLGPVDLDWYCSAVFSGSRAANIDGTAYGWRCKSV